MKALRVAGRVAFDVAITILMMAGVILAWPGMALMDLADMVDAHGPDWRGR